MIGGNHYQRFTILSRPFVNGTDSTVEIMCFLHQEINIIKMSIIIQLRTFNHHEETIIILA